MTTKARSILGLALLCVVGLLNGMSVISPLPSSYWVMASYTSPTEDVKLFSGMTIFPSFSCTPASYFDGFLHGNSSEYRQGIVGNGELFLYNCSLPNCSRCNALSKLPLDTFVTEEYSYTMFTINRLPDIPLRSIVSTTITSVADCPASADNIAHIGIQRPSCASLDQVHFGGQQCNEAGSVSTTNCSDNQCLKDCTVLATAPFYTCGDYGDAPIQFGCYLPQTPQATDMQQPRSTTEPKATSRGPSSKETSILAVHFLIVAAIMIINI